MDTILFIPQGGLRRAARGWYRTRLEQLFRQDRVYARKNITDYLAGLLVERSWSDFDVYRARVGALTGQLPARNNLTGRFDTYLKRAETLVQCSLVGTSCLDKRRRIRHGLSEAALEKELRADHDCLLGQAQEFYEGAASLAEDISEPTASPDVLEELAARLPVFHPLMYIAMHPIE